MPGHVTHADKGDGTPVCGENGFEKLVPIDEFRDIRCRAGVRCSRCTLSLGPRRKQAHEYADYEVRDRVKIEKAPRRKYNSLDAFRDKSLNRILIDGVPCGFLALEMGWGKPWHLETIDGVFVCKCLARNKPGCLPDALERFDAGELPTEAMLERRKADRLRQEQERAEHTERLKAQRLYRVRGYSVPEGYRFDTATHPHEVQCWQLAEIAFERLQGTELQEILNQIEDDS